MSCMRTAAAAAALAMVNTIAFAADPGPITEFANITVTPKASVPIGTIAVLPSNGDNGTVTYNFSVFAGESFSQTIPVEFCQTSTGGSAWSSYDMGVLASNGSALVVPTATPIQFANGEVSCKTLNIDVNTGPLNLPNPANPVIRQRLIRLVKTAQDPVSPDVRVRNEGFDGYKPSSIVVRITVNPIPESVACWLTDSSGEFLADINGDPVDESGSSAGTFTLIVNAKKIEVATNPGQFYFNMSWWNRSNAPRTVVGNIPTSSLVNLAAQGRNSLHSALFQGMIDQSDFQTYFSCANDGSDCYSTPHGNSGVTAPITVPAKATMLLTYHLEWSRIRSKFPAGCVDTGSGYRCPISALGIITEGGAEIARCSASATGYPK
jgi:hypothetical protein